MLTNSDSAMTHARRFLTACLIGACSFGTSLWSQENAAPASGPAANGHLEAIQKRVGCLSMRLPGGGHATPRLLQPPLMWTGNKGGNPDGAVCLWVAGDFPIAVLSVWNR